MEVQASSVTTADWRFRAAAFPGIMWLPGRLMAGFLAPRKKILGGEFAGRIVTAGRNVTRLKPGDEVFGFSGQGAHAEYFTRSGETYDVILDPVGKTAFSKCKCALKPHGVHVFLEFGLTEILQAMVTSMGGGRKVVIGVSGDTQEDLAFTSRLLESGVIRPVIDSRLPLERIAEAHRRVEGRHKTGSVVVTIAKAGPSDQASD